MNELIIYLIALPIAYLANTTGGVAVGTLQHYVSTQVLEISGIKPHIYDWVHNAYVNKF